MADPMKRAMDYVDDNCLASAVCILMDETKRLRDALQEISDADGAPYHLEIAREALKGE